MPDEVLPLQKDYTIVGLEISRKSRPLLWAQKFSDPCSEIFDPGAVQEQQSQYQAGKEGEETGGIHGLPGLSSPSPRSTMLVKVPAVMAVAKATTGRTTRVVLFPELGYISRIH